MKLQKLLSNWDQILRIILMIIFALSAITKILFPQNIGLDLQNIRLIELDTIGCNNCNKPYELFSIPRDLYTTEDGTLYILDARYKEIRIFDQNGNYIRTLNIPDEIIRPSSITVSHDNFIFITEQLRRNRGIYKLNMNGDIINYFRINFTPYHIRYVNKQLYVSSFPVFAKNNQWLVHVFNADGKIIKEFCHRRANWQKETQLNGGTNGFMAIKGNKLFFSFGYPYDVRIFNTSGDSINQFTRTPEFYSKIITRKAKNGINLKYYGGFCSGLVPVGENYVIVLIDNQISNKIFADLWSIDGTFIKSFDLGSVRVPYLYMTANGPEKDFYIAFYEPFPHIKKMRLQINNYQ
ncbi:MAG: hypothetical protein ACTSWR_01690 [Candidatus Helarchaeota archaeon]